MRCKFRTCDRSRAVGIYFGIVPLRFVGRFVLYLDRLRIGRNILQCKSCHIVPCSRCVANRRVGCGNIKDQCLFDRTAESVAHDKRKFMVAVDVFCGNSHARQFQNERNECRKVELECLRMTGQRIGKSRNHAFDRFRVRVIYHIHCGDGSYYGHLHLSENGGQSF